MKPALIPAAITLLLATACNEGETVQPRPPLGGQGELVGQDFHFKIKPDEWEAFGTPGDEASGYVGTANASILSNEIAQHGTVRLYVMRNFGNYAQLPMLGHEGGPLGLNWRFTYRAGSVQVILDKNGAPFSPPGEVTSFKLVVFAN
jgi:hypothetical protein